MSEPTSFTVTLTFRVTDRTDPFFRFPVGIAEELESWAESLNAIVDDVQVRPAEQEEA